MTSGAIKLVLEPIFEANLQPGSYGYRPKRKAYQAIAKAGDAIALKNTKVIDIDLRDYFDIVRHHILLAK